MDSGRTGLHKSQRAHLEVRSVTFTREFIASVSEKLAAGNVQRQDNIISESISSSLDSRRDNAQRSFVAVANQDLGRSHPQC